MLAATRGVKAESFSVVDFMPGDSLTWVNRSKRRSKGIKHPAAQASIIKQSFGFR